MAVIFCGCRKGDGFSLSSRKALLTGNWVVESGTVEIETRLRSNDTSFYFDIAPSTANLTIRTGGSYTTGTLGYSLKLDIKKDHHFYYSESVGSYHMAASGQWSFNAGKGKADKKDEVHFVIDHVGDGSTDDGFLFCKSSASWKYTIVGLSKKKLTLQSATYTFVNAKGEYQGIRSTLVFKPV